MKKRLAAAIVVGGIVCSGSAGAQDKAACLEASSQAQVLRDAHKLVETRARLRICAHRECPKVVQEDCATWLEEVEKILPSVVLSANDEAGRALLNVKVSIDGKVVGNQLDGVAISLDPGTHRVRLEAVSGAFYDRQIVIKEGEQRRPIAVVLGKPVEDVVPVDAPEAVETSPDIPPDEAPTPTHGSGLRVAGFVVGGVGLGGLVLGTVFGVLAIGSKDQAACTPDGYCAPGPLADARSQATVATVGLVAGGVLLATGITLILVAPKSAPTESAFRLELAPVLGGSYAGLLVGGHW